MADSSKRGKDYNKRLNYDELKDKITKTKPRINAPYRTATVIRNSNQMQNLLAMSTFDMEEHQFKLQKEQVKQSKKDEMINKEQPQSNVPVVSIADDVERSQGDLQDVYEDSFELLEKSQEEQKKAVIEQNKEELSKTGNLGSKRAAEIAKGLQMAADGASNKDVKEGLQKASLGSKIANVALTGTKQLVQIGAATAAGAAGANPAVAAVAHQATGSLLQAGYETVTGGASSSSVDFSRYVAKTPSPSPSKVAPGEEFGATPERNVDAEKLAHQEKANTTNIKTIITIMKKAYKNNQLNDTQKKNWEKITKESEGMANTDQSGRGIIEDLIRQEYMVYLSYQQGTFKTRSPSKPRGRSVTRREKSPEATHPRSKSRAKSEPSGYDGYSIVQLKEIAKQKKIKNYSTMKKSDLTEALKSK